MRNPLLLLNIVTWPLIYVFMSISGKYMWYWQLSMTLLVLLYTVLALAPNRIKKLRLLILLTCLTLMYLGGIEALPPIGKIFSVFIPALAIAFLLFAERSEKAKAILFNFYIAIAFSYFAISGLSPFLNLIVGQTYMYYFVEGHVFNIDFQSITQSIQLLITTVLLIIPSFISIMLHTIKNEKNL